MECLQLSYFCRNTFFFFNFLHPLDQILGFQSAPLRISNGIALMLTICYHYWPWTTLMHQVLRLCWWQFMVMSSLATFLQVILHYNQASGCPPNLVLSFNVAKISGPLCELSAWLGKLNASKLLCDIMPWAIREGHHYVVSYQLNELSNVQCCKIFINLALQSPSWLFPNTVNQLNLACD